MIGCLIFVLLPFYQHVSGVPLNATIEDREWKNDFDQPLSFECPAGQHISRMRSLYNYRKEDRRWDFECRQGLASENCYWLNHGNFVNEWDRDVNRFCQREPSPTKQFERAIMVGFSSVDNNKKGDRRWKIKCCELTRATKPVVWSSCEWVKICHYQEFMDYVVPSGKAIHAIYSVHKGYDGPFKKIEDRQWHIQLCKFSECTATSMKLLSKDFLPRPTGTAVVAIGTMPVCTEGSKGIITVSRTRGTSETVGVTTSTSTSFAIGASLTIEKTVGVNVKAFESSLTLGFTASTETTQSWGKEITTDESEYSEDAAEGSIEIIGIRGGYITGLVDEYQFDMSDIPVEYKYKCTTSVPDEFTYHKENGTIHLNGHVYGHVHFDNHQQAWTSEEECEQNKECLRDLNSREVLEPRQLLAEFKKCFPGST